MKVLRGVYIILIKVLRIVYIILIKVLRIVYIILINFKKGRKGSEWRGLGGSLRLGCG